MKRLQILTTLVSIFLLSSQDIRSAIPSPPEKIFCHTLFYEFSDSIQTDEKNQFLGLFRGLPEKIKGLNQVVISDVLTSSTQFDIMVTLKFNDKKGLAVYQEHGDHDKINTLGEKLISNYAYFRYWE
ncbi:MAG: Dabb family protein [Allomuricauda sp.]